MDCDNEKNPILQAPWSRKEVKTSHIFYNEQTFDIHNYITVMRKITISGYYGHAKRGKKNLMITITCLRFLVSETHKKQNIV